MPIYTKKPVVRRRRSSTKPQYSVKPRASRKTPFGDSGEIIGSSVAKMFGLPTASGGAAGRWLSSGLGKVLFGSGEYIGNLDRVNVNSIINPQSTPSMVSGSSAQAGDSVIIRKKEYIKDIVSSATANTIQTETFVINPGNTTTFPHLAQIARNYEEYQLRGACFHFKSLSGDSVASVQSGLGYVALATQYDSYDTTFTTKSQIENYSMSQSGKPSIDQVHGIECSKNLVAQNHLYIRPAAQPANSDLRLYDLGKTTVMTSCPGTSVTLGELWISFDVELFKPKLPENSVASSSHTSRSNVSTTTLNYGSISLQQVGSIPITASSSSLSWTGIPQNTYCKVDLSWQMDTGGVTTLPVQTVSAGTAELFFASSSAIDATSSTFAPTPVSASTKVLFSYVITPDANGTITITTASGACNATAFGFDAFCNPLETNIST